MTSNNEVLLYDAIQSFQLSTETYHMAEEFCSENGVVKADFYRKLQKYFIESVIINIEKNSL